MAHYFEIACFGMTSSDDGGFINAEAVNKTPDFFDVIVTKRYTHDDPRWSEVEVVEEFEGLEEETAWEMFAIMERKYPDADVCY